MLRYVEWGRRFARRLCGVLDWMVRLAGGPYPYCLTSNPSCSTLPTAALDYASGGPGKVGVSQSVTITYHAPAVLYVTLFMALVSLG